MSFIFQHFLWYLRLVSEEFKISVGYIGPSFWFVPLVQNFDDREDGK